MSQTKLEAWHEMAQLLKTAKIREAELRRELCADFIANTPMTNGRVTVKGHDGNYDYKAVQILSYRVDQSVLSSVWSTLDDIEKAAVAYKPSLALANYKKLSEESLLHEAVITTLAMPTLEVTLSGS